MKTAEFVSPKHPDKLCDRVSDALLGLFLTNDENARCAIEVCGGHSKIFITGEVTSEYQLVVLLVEKMLQWSHMGNKFNWE